MLIDDYWPSVIFKIISCSDHGIRAKDDILIKYTKEVISGNWIIIRDVTDPDPARIRAKFWIRIRAGSSEFVLPDPILKNIVIIFQYFSIYVIIFDNIDITKS